MARTVLLNCPIKAKIRAVDGQSDLRINFVIVMIIVIIIIILIAGGKKSLQS